MQAEDGPTRSVPFDLRPAQALFLCPVFVRALWPDILRVNPWPRCRQMAHHAVYIPMTVDHIPQRNFLNFYQLDTSSTEGGDPPSLIRLECVSSPFDYSQNAVPSQHVDAACRPRKQSRVSGADLDSSLATTTPAPVCEICLGRYAQAEWKKMAFYLKALFFVVE
jgi:hypothetical protein